MNWLKDIDFLKLFFCSKGTKFYEYNTDRVMNGKESILPLNYLLKMKYVGLFDHEMSKLESDKTKKNLILVSIMMIPVFLIVFINQFLIDLNKYLHDHTLIEFHTPKVEGTQINNKSNEKNTTLGYFPKQLLQVFGSKPKPATFITNRHCLPVVSEMENAPVFFMLKVYCGIIFSITLLAVYIDRLRMICAGCVYPRRDQERNIWLFNHILEIRSMKILNEPASENNDSYVVKVFRWIIYKLSYFFLDLVFQNTLRLFCW